MGGRGTTSKDRYKSTGEKSADAPEGDSQPAGVGLHEPEIGYEKSKIFGDNYDAADRYQKAQYNRQVKDMDEDAKNTLNEYSYHGNEDINGFLRYGNDPSKLYTSKDEVNKAISTLDGVIDKFKTANNMVVWRGMPGALPENITIGSVISDKGFTSTSVNENVAARFTYQPGLYPGMSEALVVRQPTVVYKITIPKGSKGVFMGTNTTKFRNESEFILPRNAKMKVRNITEGQFSRKYVHLVLETD